MGRKLSYSPSADIYFCFCMDFMSNAIGTEAPNSVDFGILDVNASDEFNTLCTPATKVRRLMDAPHWYARYHVSGETIAVGMIVTS